VVEYGDIGDDSILVPGSSMFNPRFMFPNLQSVPQVGLNNRTFSVSIGRVVGGSSAVNAQMFDRGSATDYDAWAAVSKDATSAFEDAGWNWKGLLPYFRKVSHFPRGLIQE